MGKPYTDALHSARKSREEYVATLTDAERTAFLLQLLSESNDPPPQADASELDQPLTLSPGPSGWLPPDEQSIELDTAAHFVAEIRFAQGRLLRNERWRSRCGCDQTGSCSTHSNGQSYITVDYNSGGARGVFDIVVYIRRYGRDTFGHVPWDRFVNCLSAYKLWESGRLTGPGSPGRGGYFSTGNNQTPGPRTGTLGVAAYLPGTNTLAWTGRWYFDDGSEWGAEWLHCGKDYEMWFQDA